MPEITCKCGAELDIKHEAIGQVLDCPKCGEPLMLTPHAKTLDDGYTTVLRSASVFAVVLIFVYAITAAFFVLVMFTGDTGFGAGLQVLAVIFVVAPLAAIVVALYRIEEHLRHIRQMQIDRLQRNEKAGDDSP